MKVVGIVAEYNPFHKGHAYQIAKIREIVGEDTAVVCVMSGDFVQRGEPAIFSKYARAEAAVRCGADLILELPVHYSIASAERFAEGAIHILGKLGVVDYIAFGSESGQIEHILNTAEVLLTSEFDHKIKEILETGCSYPTARTMALKELCGQSTVTESPNDNLGVEYVKAIKKYGYSMKPIAVKRIGAMHDELFDGEFKSGSEIRGLLRNGEEYNEYVPEPACSVYEREICLGCGPVSLQSLELAMLSRLRMLPRSAFTNLLDASEGLDSKLYSACKIQKNMEGIYDFVKSKRYTHARIRRMTMSAVLGIGKDVYCADHLYARVLALNSRGGRVLRMSEAARTIPVLSKPAMARDMDENRLSAFELSASAHDLYVLGYENEDMRIGEQDWITSPVFIKDVEQL